MWRLINVYSYRQLSISNIPSRGKCWKRRKSWKNDETADVDWSSGCALKLISPLSGLANEKQICRPYSPDIHKSFLIDYQTESTWRRCARRDRKLSRSNFPRVVRPRSLPHVLHTYVHSVQISAGHRFASLLATIPDTAITTTKSQSYLEFNRWKGLP